MRIQLQKQRQVIRTCALKTSNDPRVNSIKAVSKETAFFFIFKHKFLEPQTMRTALLILCFSFFSIYSWAQEIDLGYYLPQHATYDPAIPTPDAIIGHQVGQWHITHDKLVAYMEVLAQASDRITIEKRGTTYEGRPLVLLTITAPQNHKRIEDIRKNHVALTEPEGAQMDLSEMPIVVNQGFSIHGNEPSGANASLLLAYHLAAAQGPEIEALLNHTIILLDPSFNPDGLQRFSTWANMHKAQNVTPDPNDREYSEVWPGGRTNHYWFDLNRDWMPGQLPESQARLKTFHQWYPNILTDHHEMGTNATFFFQPGIPSRTHPLTPKKNQELTEAIGQFHAKALDGLGSLYYTQEDYDDFYYGKGSTFPDIHGAVGILFEQASSRGHAQESDNGILTFPFTVRNQLTAALSTLEAAQAMRTTLLSYQRSFYAQIRDRKTKREDAFVFGDANDPGKVQHFIDLLQRQKIAVYGLKSAVKTQGHTFTPGSAFVIPKKQKQATLIEAMFEKRTTFQDSLFYDISAWTLPLAFDLNYGTINADQKADLIQGSILAPAQPIRSAYAYALRWTDYDAPKALAALHKKGIRVKVALKPFSLGGQSFDYGTLMIVAHNQLLSPEDITVFLESLNDGSLSITPLDTGLTTGIDLGSKMFETVAPKSIALLVGNGVSPYDAGEIWHLLDTRFDIPVTKLDADQLRRKDLSRYSTIIVPALYGSGLDAAATKQIKEWVQQGGHLIAYRTAARWLNKQELLPLSIKEGPETDQDSSFEQRQLFNGAQVIGGAIFEAQLDRSHPISFGYDHEHVALFRNTTVFIDADEKRYNNPIQYTASPLLSGYISNDNLDLLKNSSAFKTKALGRGRVSYFTDNTNFRGFWYGTNKLLMNAVFFGNQM